jgi:hypothetical protein
MQGVRGVFKLLPMTRRPWLLSVSRTAALVALLSVPAIAESLSVRVRAAEERITVNVDEFKARKFYETTLVNDIGAASDVFYPYISCSVEDGERVLFGYIRTKSSDWLMLKGMVVLVGEKRYTYYPDPLVALSMRGSDCASSYYGITCAEWFHLPARRDDELSKIFAAIAGAPDSVPVKVRADGSDGNADWELTKDERQAWKDIVFYYLNFSLRTK